MTTSSATAPGASTPRLGRAKISSGRVARTRHRRRDVEEGLCTTNASGETPSRASSATAHDTNVWVEGKVVRWRGMRFRSSGGGPWVAAMDGTRVRRGSTTTKGRTSRLWTVTLDGPSPRCRRVGAGRGVGTWGFGPTEVGARAPSGRRTVSRGRGGRGSPGLGVRTGSAGAFRGPRRGPGRR